MLKEETIRYFETRTEWREWLTENFGTTTEVWFVFPNKSSNKKAVSYNDAVEEALCFGWIDSTVRTFDKEHKMQRFTPRKPKSSYSQANRERLAWLLENNRIHPGFRDEIQRIVSYPFTFPDDIIHTFQSDSIVWENYQSFSDSYKRIRIAYIDAARKRPEEFEKRLNHFITKTRENKIIPGFGGIDKYY